MLYWDQKALEARLSGEQSVAPLEAQQVQQWGPLLDLAYHPALLVVQGDKKPLRVQLRSKVLGLRVNLRCLAVDFRRFINHVLQALAFRDYPRK